MHTFLKISLSATAIAVCLTSFANDNKKAIEFYNAGLLNPAKNILKENIQKGDVNKAEACYYLGEIYYDSNNLDSAAYYYKEGLVANPLDSYNQIGQAKLALKGNPEATGKLIEAIVKNKANKKNAAIWVAAAKAYFVTGVSKAKALEYIEKAKLVDEKYADTYVLQGDIAAADKDYGNASSLYEQAIYFDPHCYHAYLKSSRIYANLNVGSSIDMLKRLLEVYPQSPVAEKELAELYYQNGQFGKAKEVYAEHLKNGFATTSDKLRYANILMFAEDYTKSLTIVKDLMKDDPQNLVAKRIYMYDLFNLKDTIQGLKAAEDFMKSASKSDYITKDFVYYGYLLADNKNYENSISAFQSALEMDSTKTDLYKDIANAYERLRNYQKSIENYSIFMNKAKDAVTTMDYFKMGQTYYSAGSDTTLEHSARIKYYQSADSLFKIVSEKLPDAYLGFFWRARTNASIDPTSEQGLAKPYYEQALTLLEKEGTLTSLLIECYRYLGYYHYLKNESEQSIYYWNKILALDPSNDLAKQAIEGMTKPVKKKK